MTNLIPMSEDGVVIDYLANVRNEVTMSENEVKRKLREIGPLKGFKVTFIKKSGEIRTIFGSLDVFQGDPKDGFKSAVPMIEESTGQFRSFRIDSVVEIVV